MGLLVFWLKKVSYHFVKPMVGYKAKQLIKVVKSLIEIVFAREYEAGLFFRHTTDPHVPS